MGLDTSHDAWHGAYSAFTRWRRAVAAAGGYTVRDEPGGYVDLDWGGVQAVIGDDLTGDWPSVPVRPDGTPDPLLVLLAHSDCDGDIQVDMLKPLADRLEEILPLLNGNGDYREGATTASFIAGLRLAAARGERLEFR